MNMIKSKPSFCKVDQPACDEGLEDPQDECQEKEQIKEPNMTSSSDRVMKQYSERRYTSIQSLVKPIESAPRVRWCECGTFIEVHKYSV